MGCGYDTLASGAGQGEVLGKRVYGRDFVQITIDNLQKNNYFKHVA
jgi:hypothetical protein